MHPTALLGINNRTHLTLADLQKAALQFHPIGGNEAWENGCRIGQQVTQGKPVSSEVFKNDFVAGYLNRWRSRLLSSSAACLLSAMKRCRDHLLKLPPHLVEIETKHLLLVGKIFDYLVQVRGVGSTTASKTLSAMRPQLFVIWDRAIAAHYGFAHNPTGYCRFLWSMGSLCRELCEFSGEPPSRVGAKKVEERIKGKLGSSAQSRTITLAKLLDEWNWVRITTNGVLKAGA